MSIGSILQAARERQQLTRQELAERLSINVNSLIKYERAGEVHGQLPPLPTLARLCSHLDIDPRVIMAEAAEDEIDKSAILDRHLEEVRSVLTAFDKIKSLSDAVTLSASRLLHSIEVSEGSSLETPNRLREKYPEDMELARALTTLGYLTEDEAQQYLSENELLNELYENEMDGLGLNNPDRPSDSTTNTEAAPTASSGTDQSGGDK